MRRELVRSRVRFDSGPHRYTLDGRELRGVTGMLERRLFPDKYRGVPDTVLQAAAVRGSIIHGTIELADDIGLESDMEEVKGYALLKERHGLVYEASEYIVSDNERFASCVDKVFRESDTEFSLADIKTTYRLDTEYVRWQLSVYAHLFETQNPGCSVVSLYGIWLRGDRHELVRVERIPDEVIMELLDAEAGDRPFANPYAVPAGAGRLPDKYLAMENCFAEAVEQARYWKERLEDMKDGLMREMVKAGVYLWKGDRVSVIRKKETCRKVFDRDRFEADYPGIYERYMKEVPVTGSVTLKTY